MATIRNLLLRLGVDVDPLDRGFAKAAKAVSTFDKHFSRVAKVGAVGAGLGAATGAATALTAALAPAAGALIAMPGAMIAAKAATATLKIGLLGVGEAMSAVGTKDAKALKEALKELSPNAREFVKASSGIMKSFDPIRKAVQDRLFEGLGKELAPVGRNLLPAIKTGMVGAAGGFNAMGKEALAFGQTPLAKGVVTKVFDTTSRVLTKAATAVQPLLKGIASLVVQSLPLAERMANWAINGAKAAGAFLSSEKGASKLAEWAVKAGDTLERLGRIGSNLAGFMGGIFKGAKGSGDGVLETLENITQKMETFAQSAGGQDQIREGFTLLLQILRAVVGVLPLFLGPLGAVMKILTDMSPEVRGVVVQFLAFSVVGVALAGKLSGLLSVVKGVSVAAVAAGGAALKFGSGLLSGAAGLDKNAGAAARAGAAVRTFGSTLSSGISTSASFITNMTSLAGAKAKVALQSALAATKQGLHTAAMVLGNVASKALAVGVRLVGVAMKFALGPVGLIITAIGLLIGAVVLAYNKNEGFRKLVQTAWKAIQTAISYAWNSIIKPAFNALVSFIATLVTRFSSMYTNVRTYFRNLGTAISTVWNSTVKPVFTNLSNFITKTIPNAFQTGVKAIGTFWSKVEGVAKKPITFMVNTVYNKGIRGVWNWVASKVGIGGQLPEIKGFRTGGPITQGTHGTADDVMIRASRGEFMVNAASTKRNAGLIDYVNRFGRNKDVLKEAGFAGDPGNMNIPGYKDGGIIGWVSSFIEKGKDFFMSGFHKAASAALNPVVNLARSTMGTSGVGGLMTAGVSKIVNGILDKFKPLESKLAGGGGGKVVAAARSQIGVPYSWGGGGPGGPSYGIGRGAGTRGFDCSGLTEYAWYKAIGRSIGGTTYAQKGILDRISTPRPGAVGQPHAGHTYLMSAPGKIIEAPFTGGFVREVPMRNTPWWGWPKGVTASSVMDDGGVIRPGWNAPIFNGTGRTEGVFTSDMIKAMAGGNRGGNTYNLTVQVAAGASPAEVGRQIVASIKEYERTNGTRWRGNP